MALNVLGTPLLTCSTDPLTGFFRDGCCNSSEHDPGQHTVCAQVDEQFLEFSASVGNDLSTPQPLMGFQGLKPGDFWCLCLPRWIEAYQAGRAPKIKLSATHISVSEHVDRSVLHQYAVSE